MTHYALVGLAFTMLLLWAIDDAIFKKIAPKLKAVKSAVLAMGIGTLPILIAYLIYGGGTFGYGMLLLSAIAGISLGVGYIFVYKSLETEQLTNTMSIIVLQYGTIALFGIFALGEHVAFLQGVGIAIIFSGVILISTMKDLSLNKNLSYAIIGNILWAIYWIILVITIEWSNGFLMPLLLSRSIGFFFIALFGVLFLGKAKRSRSVKLRLLGVELISLMIFATLLDGIGNVIFGYIAVSNYIAIGSAILATEPIIIALLGKIIYRDKLTRVQTLGLALGVIGAIIVSIF